MNPHRISRKEILSYFLVMAVVILIGLLGPGCATTKSGVPHGTISALSSSVTALVIVAYVPEADRHLVASQARAIAHGIRKLAGGKAPSVPEVREAILVFGGDKVRWAALSEGVAGVYEDFYKTNVDEDTRLALEVLESIAEGVERGADAIEDSQP